MMRTNLLEVVMGAVVLIVAVFFIIFSYSTSQWRNRDGYEVYAKFDRIDGLISGTDVRMSGVKVGTVVDIQLDPESYLAVVKVKLLPEIRIPVDSAAEIVSDGLLGSKLLSIVPGGEDTMIAAGGEIMYTQAAVSLESLIGKFMFSSQEKKGEAEPQK